MNKLNKTESDIFISWPISKGSPFQNLLIINTCTTHTLGGQYPPNNKCENTNSSGGPDVKILLTLDTERYRSNFDIGGKLGHCYINQCIAGKHELHFVKTCLFLPRPSRYLQNSEYTKRCQTNINVQKKII